jgi:hypothetical protein
VNRKRLPVLGWNAAAERLLLFALLDQTGLFWPSVVTGE